MIVTFNKFYFIEVMHLQMEGINEKIKREWWWEVAIAYQNRAHQCVCMFYCQKFGVSYDSWNIVKCNLFLWSKLIFSIITPVFSVTRSSEIILNMLIYCLRNISDYYQCWKQLCSFIFVWKLFQDSLMNWKHLFEMEIFTFDLFNASSNKGIYIYK